MNPPLARSIPILLFALAGCASTDELNRDELEPYEAGAVRAEDVPIGKLLADVDAQVATWSRLILSAQDETERLKARGLELNLARITKPRTDEIIEQLETGPPLNRIRAAAALGFTKVASAQGPLLSALFDPSPDVVNNALFSLANLQRADTPLERVCELSQVHPDAQVRSNAYRAILWTLDAGGHADCATGAARAGLGDPDPFSRFQAALILGVLKDAPSIPVLKDLLFDEHALVARAAASSLSAIANRVDESRGEAARALVDAYGRSDGERQEMLHGRLIATAGDDLGSDLEDWAAWANNLP